MKTYPLKRYPDGKTLFEEIQKGGGGWVEHRLIPPHALMLEMCNPDLGAEIAAATGNHDGIIQGKYRCAQVFFFDAGGEVVMSVTEQGSQGGTWCWLTQSAQEYQTNFGGTYSDSLLSFWPQFLLDLNAALSWGKSPSNILDARAFEKLAAQATLDQLGVLETEVASPPAAPKRRLR